MHRRRQRRAAPDDGVSVDTTPPGGSGAGAATVCTACGAPLAEGFAFCESCGTPTGTAPTVPVGPGVADPAAPVTTDEPAAGEPPTTPGPEGEAGDPISARTTLQAHPTDDATQHTTPSAPTCSCGGTFEDGWCTTCGAPGPTSATTWW